MKTTISIKKKISVLEKEIDVLNRELVTLKGKRGEDYRTRREELKYEIKEKYSLIRDYKDDIRSIKRVYRNIGWGLLHLVCLSILVLGIVLLVRYSYEKGLYIFTETHDLVSTFKGDESLISVDLYNHLFKLRLSGFICFSTGLILEIVTLFLHLIWDN